MIRTIFVWSCIVLATLVLGVFALITYPFDRKGRVGHYYAKLWGKVALLANRVKVRVEGMGHLNGQGPYIFMSNHQGSGAEESHILPDRAGMAACAEAMDCSHPRHHEVGAPGGEHRSRCSRTCGGRSPGDR